MTTRRPLAAHRFVRVVPFIASSLVAACSFPPADTAPPDARQCGGLSGLGCAEGELCAYPLEAICGAADATGICTKVPEVCTREYAPVCGCDDKTYPSECSAHAAGVSVSALGECATSATSATSCDRRELRCRRAEPACPEGQVPSVVEHCYGACVPIDQCSCDEPDDCYNTDAYTCHLHKGRCGPYVN